MSIPNSKPVTVLVVDDDDLDAKGLERAFQKSKIANPLVFAENGIEALQILRGQHPEKTITKPFVVLLDLNMPKMDGFEFLDELRNDAALKSSIVFVLTSSDADRDKTAAYANNIAGYIVKANAGSQFLAIPEFLDTFWRVVELPPE